MHEAHIVIKGLDSGPTLYRKPPKNTENPRKLPKTPENPLYIMYKSLLLIRIHCLSYVKGIFYGPNNL